MKSKQNMPQGIKARGAIIAGVIASVFACSTAAQSSDGLPGAAAPKAPAPVGAPPAQRAQRSAASEPKTGASTPAASDAAATANLSELIALLCQKDLWPLRPEQAEQKLQALGPFTHQQPPPLTEEQVKMYGPTPNNLSLVGGSHGPLKHSEIAFGEGSKRDLVFQEAGFYVGGSDLPQLFKTIESLVTEKLGKPKWHRKGSDGDLPVTEWKLKRALTLTLSQNVFQGERVVFIAIGEPQGP